MTEEGLHCQQSSSTGELGPYQHHCFHGAVGWQLLLVNKNVISLHVRVKPQVMHQITIVSNGIAFSNAFSRLCLEGWDLK